MQNESDKELFEKKLTKKVLSISWSILMLSNFEAFCF